MSTTKCEPPSNKINHVGYWWIKEVNDQIPDGHLIVWKWNPDECVWTVPSIGKEILSSDTHTVEDFTSWGWTVDSEAFPPNVDIEDFTDILKVLKQAKEMVEVWDNSKSIFSSRQKPVWYSTAEKLLLKYDNLLK